MKRICGRGMSGLLMAALVSLGGIGAVCFFTQRPEEKIFQEEETEKLKTQVEQAEAGIPEKAGPDPEGQRESRKKEKREDLYRRPDVGTSEEKEQMAEENRKKKEEKRQREEAENRVKNVEEMLAKLYDPASDSVAMNTSKNSKIFQDVQTEIWKLPLSYEQKHREFQKTVDRISDEWHYINDDLHYETETLKISVQKKDVGYTKYWVCHVETFNPRQLCSALCGGTYGNPRKPVSEELAAHNGVIGVNGSGFSYGTGIPAPGKTMIKNGKIYNDVYSNGNIFCVTQDGGMFTAAAGMTAEDMLNRGVKDTYCFGPTLIENGKVSEISGQFTQTARYQRTAVGMVHPGEYYLVAVDGKGAGGSEGMTYQELQQVFLDLGCEYAYHLDGGGSTTLVFKGRVLNMLTDGGKERPCADILYFIDAGDGAEGEGIVIHENEAMIRPSSGKSSLK
ncbi:phosphodiester glycosidase family protein [Blautia sp. XA-2221]|uniref:phosphodiester glycosidase family protein n=1 Tax=Blautia sp. XA-2221 TaxID=2903961 RepID=UPI002378F335|nr:phosphodiester glycosidase family protein [Blautia sp. XA-2221]